MLRCSLSHYSCESSKLVGTCTELHCAKMTMNMHVDSLRIYLSSALPPNRFAPASLGRSCHDSKEGSNWNVITLSGFVIALVVNPHFYEILAWSILQGEVPL